LKYLNWLDYTSIIFYLAVIMGIGVVVSIIVYLKKKGKAGLEDYFLGGRKLPWWALGIAGMAHSLDLGGTMLIVSLFYILGPRGLFIEFRGGASLILALMLIFTAKYHQRSKCITGAHWMIFRFGDGFGGRFAQLARVVGGVAFTVSMLALLIKGTGGFLSTFMGYSPFVCTLIMMGVATAYSMISGFHGVVIADLFQATIILAVSVYVVATATMKIGGCEDFGALAASVTGQKDWMSSVAQWQTTMPKGYESYRWLFLFAICYLGKSIFNGMSTGDDPKNFGSKDEVSACKTVGTWMTTLTIRWPMMIAFAALGVFMVAQLLPDQSILSQAADLIRQHYPNAGKEQWDTIISAIVAGSKGVSTELINGLHTILGDADWASKVQLVSFEGTVNPEKILPSVVLFSTTPGVRGLILIALVAASMSTFDMTVNMCAGLLVKDIYSKYISPMARNRELIFASWVSVVLIVVASFLFAARLESINEIWGWLMMGLFGGLTIPMLLRLYWWRFNGGGFAIGTFVGVAAAIIEMIVVKTWPEWAVSKYLGNELILLIYVSIVGLIGSIIGTYLTEPTDRKLLERFYRTTRPIGLWGPLKSCLPAGVRKRVEKEHAIDIATIPFALLFQITLLMMPLQLVVRSFRAFQWTLGLFIIGVLGMYFLWFRNLPASGNWEPELVIDDPGVPEELTPVAEAAAEDAGVPMEK
jgi:SSS family solute:Na+ symporter